MNTKQSITIAFILIYLEFFPTKLQAQIADSKQFNNLYSPVNFRQPEPPPDAPKTGRAKGGASRGECFMANSKSEIKLTPLLPLNGWGLTVSESPTLWIYVSYPSGKFGGETPLIAELSVEEREIDLKLEPKSYAIELPKTSGTFSITFPHSLKLDKWYRWYLVINCQPENSSANDVLQLEGFLHRKELNNLKGYSESLSPPELINFYIQNQIWYDAFHEAALLHCNNWPDNELRNYWQALLKSEEVELDEVSNQSLICNK